MVPRGYLTKHLHRNLDLTLKLLMLPNRLRCLENMAVCINWSPFLGGRTIRALLFGVYIEAPDFWKPTPARLGLRLFFGMSPSSVDGHLFIMGLAKPNARDPNIMCSDGGSKQQTSGMCYGVPNPLTDRNCKS